MMVNEWGDPHPTPQFWPELPDDIIPPSERAVVEMFRQIRRNFVHRNPNRRNYRDDHRYPLFQAPPDFTTIIDRCIMETYPEKGNSKHRDTFFMPNDKHLPDVHESGFIVADHHVVGIHLAISQSQNDLIPCPISFGDLPHLQAISISHAFSDLPANIGQCTQLRFLDLHGNQMSALPPEIGQCTQLQGLDLYSLGLTVLPPEIGRLTALEQLDCAQNQLTDLPVEFEQLHALQRVDLSHNRFIEIPRALYHLPSVRRILLAFNQLTHVSPDVFTSLPHLEYLDLIGNPLQTIYGLLQQGDRVAGCCVPSHVQLPPYAMDLLNHWNDSTLDALKTYYAKSVGELTLDLVRTGHITPEETNRLVHEATLDERTILEDHLPPDHPVLQRLNARLQIPLRPDKVILL